MSTVDTICIHVILWAGLSSHISLHTYFLSIGYVGNISLVRIVRLYEYSELRTYCILLFVRGESFAVFVDYFVTAKVFRRNFSLLCSNLAIIGRIFSNCEYLSGNEGKDLQSQNFFTANKKQYTVRANLSSFK